MCVCAGAYETVKDFGVKDIVSLMRFATLIVSIGIPIRDLWCIDEVVCREVLLGLLAWRISDKALMLPPFSSIWRAGNVFIRT
jgi:hypothetical protein